MSRANSLRPVFSTELSIIHPIAHLDTPFMLAVRLISQRGGVGAYKGGVGAAVPSKAKLQHCICGE
jgi:hypothetical protein